MPRNSRTSPGSASTSKASKPLAIRGARRVCFATAVRNELKTKRGIAPLARSDILFSAVQIIREGGENSLHSHSAMDGFWFVLRGRARFYGAGDKLIGEIGQHEGVFVPRNVPYWFESVGDELLELLQVEAIDKTVKNTLTRHAPKKVLSMQVFKPEGEVIGIAGKAE